MSFNISAKVYVINNVFLFSKILQIEKPGGSGEDGSGNSHDLKTFEKTGGGPGGTGGGRDHRQYRYYFAKSTSMIYC